MSDKKQTRMMALWDGVSDDALADLVSVSLGGTIRSSGAATARAAAAAQSELERRRKAEAARAKDYRETNVNDTKPTTERESLLQDDLVAREEALGRAMALLRRVWDNSAEGTRLIGAYVEAKGGDANHWSNVVRWVAGQPSGDEDVRKELLAMAPGDTRRVRGVEVRRLKTITAPVWSVARHGAVTLDRAVTEVLDREQRREQAANGPAPAEAVTDEVDLMVEGDDRWIGLSYEELRRLYDGFEADSGSSADLALDEAMSRELVRREQERSAETYRGPGYYRHVVNGTTTKVVGKASVGGSDYALVGSSLQDPNLWAWPVTTINLRRPDGSRLYEFSEVGP